MRKANLKAKFSKAWIVRWQFYAQDGKSKLEEYGIKNEIIEILNSRKDFDDVQEYVENLYRLHMLSFTEKAYLENYKFSRKNRKQIFGVSIPVFTPYKTDLYRDMMSCFRDKGMEDPEYLQLWEKWKKYPSYISVGHNPSLEAIKVYDLQIFSDDGTEILEWKEPLENGDCVHKTYKIK